MVCGKKSEQPGFNISFTLHSQPGGNRRPGMKPDNFRLFHNFPTPYYEYYNKFNTKQPI